MYALYCRSMLPLLLLCLVVGNLCSHKRQGVEHMCHLLPEGSQPSVLLFPLSRREDTGKIREDVI